jgi:GNAT superfamily N-acetyltransferase
MILDDLKRFQAPVPSPKVQVRQIAKDEALTVAQIFMTCFDMPLEFAPEMASLLVPSIGLEGVRHYLAWVDGKPVGTCSLLRHGGYAVLGSAGVLRGLRGSGVATSLAVRAIADARRDGVGTMMLQTVAGTKLERFLRISGFRRAFTRVCYVLP